MKTSKKASGQSIILTTGDPNGIGPEIILKIFSDTDLFREYSITIAGDKFIFDAYAEILRLKKIPEKYFFKVPVPPKFVLTPGIVSALAGKHAGSCITAGVKLCLKNEHDAMVTLPISKESLNLGGFRFPGHTEMITKLTGARQSAMILYSGKLIVCLVTNHVPVSGVSKLLSGSLIEDKVIIANNSLVRDFGIRKPRIAVLALNPHGGDGGTIGKDEQNVIVPALQALAGSGFNVRGPFPADAFFGNGEYKRFDVVMPMYHDQGLIPFKMLSFGSGVNFTAGLKIVRTSPDHGTAFDIAGAGVAETGSTVEAIKTAVMISANRK